MTVRVLAACTLVAACSSEHLGLPPVADGGPPPVDARADAPEPALDGGVDAAGPDAALDAMPGKPDAGPPDATPPDAGPDACVPAPGGETCNGLDDDCDLLVDEDFDLLGDVNTCGSCTTMCVNPYGTTSCVGGTCMPTCVPGVQDCDGNPVNGCEAIRDTTPACASAPLLGSVPGDAGAATLTATAFGEEDYRVTVQETISGGVPILAQVALDVPPGVDFDLFVMCASCAAATVLSSTNVIGVDEVVNVGRDDVAGDRSYDIVIEIRFVTATLCGSWTLTVTGNVATTNRTCN